MIAAELRAGGKPSLDEALGWIGSRVDDIYGASVGSLEDVWIDPGTGAPRWLLVKEGRFGGRTTLIPFEDATAGTAHVWVPYEVDVVRTAPEIEPGAPLTHQVEAALRTHYAASAPASISGGGPERANGGVPAVGTATIRLQQAGPRPGAEPDPGPYVEPRQPIPGGGGQRAGEGRAQRFAPPRPPERPPPPIAPPEPQPPAAGWAGYSQQPQPAYQQQPPPYQQQPAYEQHPAEQLRALSESAGSHYVEIELSGELTIRGELRSVRVIPREPPR